MMQYASCGQPGPGKIPTGAEFDTAERSHKPNLSFWYTGDTVCIGGAPGRQTERLIVLGWVLATTRTKGQLREGHHKISGGGGGGGSSNTLAGKGRG